MENSIESEAPSFRLATDTFFCFRADTAVFLDLARDRYLELTASDVPLLRSLIARGAVTPEVETLGTSLLTNGLLTRGDHLGRPFAPTEVAPARATLVDEWLDESPRIGLNHVLRFIVSWSVAAFALHLGIRYATIHVGRRRTRGDSHTPPFDIDKARTLLRVFRYLRPLLFAAEDHCLLNSLALLEFLAWYRLHPNWVFGVRTTPFQAHCWLQHGDLVLDDRLAHLVPYTPIMVV